MIDGPSERQTVRWMVECKQGRQRDETVKQTLKQVHRRAGRERVGSQVGWPAGRQASIQISFIPILYQIGFIVCVFCKDIENKCPIQKTTIISTLICCLFQRKSIINLKTYC
jgi:hypothetical protein